jgi:hypothetical protein
MNPKLLEEIISRIADNRKSTYAGMIIAGVISVYLLVARSPFGVANGLPYDPALWATVVLPLLGGAAAKDPQKPQAGVPAAEDKTVLLKSAETQDGTKPDGFSLVQVLAALAGLCVLVMLCGCSTVQDRVDKQLANVPGGAVIASQFRQAEGARAGMVKLPANATTTIIYADNAGHELTNGVRRVTKIVSEEDLTQTPLPLPPSVIPSFTNAPVDPFKFLPLPTN